MEGNSSSHEGINMFKKLQKKHPHLVAISLFVGLSIILLVPHLVTKGMVTVAELIFH